jgi:hypothetical protein
MKCVLVKKERRGLASGKKYVLLSFATREEYLSDMQTEGHEL